MVKTIQVRAVLLAGCMSIHPVAAQAQALPATDGAAATAPNDIVVTAQKRSERVQDVPIQISVLTGDTLANHQIRTTAEIVRSIPNMTVERTDTYTNSVIVLRGLSQASNSDAPVAVIVDGVPQDDAKQFNMHLFDIDQIEVLKGPQGSLYGRNAEAGAVIITTKAPTNELSGFATASYSKGATVDLTGGLSGAIVPDKILFRVAGSFLRSDGLIWNSYLKTHSDKIKHDWTLRGNLLFNLSDTVTFNLIGQYGEFNAAGVLFAPVWSGNPNDNVDLQGNYPNHGSGSNGSVTGKLDADLGFATLTSITGYTKLKQIQITDVDFTNPEEQAVNPYALPFQAGDWQPFSNRIISQEVRLTSRSGQPLRWLVAADYLDSNKFINTHLFLDTGHPGTDPTEGYTLKENPADYLRSAWGVSAQIDYDFSDALTITAGARYDKDERKLHDRTAGTTRKASFDGFQPRVSLTYKLDPDKLIYASFGKGFRSGGFNPPSYPTPVYGSEKLTNYEVGFKTQFLDRKITLNGALFHSFVDNLQFYAIDYSSGSSVTSNIDRVKIDGLEFEAVVTPVPGVSLSSRLGLTDPKIDRFAANTAYEGNIIPRGYKMSYSGGIDLDHEVSPGIRLFTHADVQTYSKKYWFVDNLDVQGPRTYVNGSLGVGFGDMKLTVWGKNLFNVRAYDTYFPGQQTGLPFDVAFPNQPVSYGIDASMKF
ncbi:TonB-dependent receptor [Novosphingobium album (ex Hu et al. 2023)]|uniref:TonB-dependent receptor n=1 Tax=Novosphingobium album (ex Hu et al. 2023) TaxID=2930093 RepID=A0ABT0B7D1_9SPHN|nr:TonB-dependent receptor [Novosphingobium album (ex Hu et al. 2023)]MCJ2180956.1 TonB-dependent receptor [Novosphingobium album (ex Hu et al. 2023)]